MTHTAWRKAVSSAFVFFCVGAVLVALVPLALILFFVIKEGIQALNLDFFTHMPRPVGELGGGMANAIVGSLIITGLGALFAIPIGIMSGVYMSEYAGTTLAATIRFAADTLNGVPSIVIGVFVYAIVVLPVKQFSALAGGVATIPSTDSGLLPRSIVTRPCGLNFITMFVPSSTAQILSCGSTRTA